MNENNYITIKISDRYCQTYYFNSSTPQMLHKCILLFVSFNTDKILYFQEALNNGENSFCIMKDEESLNKKLQSFSNISEETIPFFLNQNDENENEKDKDNEIIEVIEQLKNNDQSKEEEEKEKDCETSSEIEKEQLKKLKHLETLQNQNDDENDKVNDNENDKINLLSIKINYKLPNAQELWCIIMNTIVEMTKEKAEKSRVNPKGIIISIPDMLEPSLKRMIINAIEYTEKNNEMMIKTITNSFSSSAILLFDEIRGIHSQFEDIEKMNLFGVIDYGFYWTEISLILVRDKTTIVVGKGRTNIGFRNVLKILIEMMNETKKKNDEDFEETKYFTTIISNENDQELFDDWTKMTKISCTSLSSGFVNYCNENVTKNDFITESGDTVTLERGKVAKKLKEINEHICEMIENTINETVDKLREIGRFDVNGRDFVTKNIELTYCLINSETKNQFLIDMLQQNKGIKVRDTNHGDTLIGKGASYYTNIVYHLFENIHSPQQSMIPEIVICEMIYENKFVIKDLEGYTIVKFPPNPMVSTRMIDIGKELKKDNQYKLYEKIKYEGKDDKYRIGKCKILYDGYHLIKFNNYIPTIEPAYIDPQSNKLLDMKEEFKNDMIWLELKDGNFTDYIQEQRVKYIGGTEYHEHSIKHYVELFKQVNKDSTEFVSVLDKIKKDKTYLTNETTVTMYELNSMINEIKEYSNGDPTDFKNRWEAYKKFVLDTYPKKEQKPSKIKSLR